MPCFQYDKIHKMAHDILSKRQRNKINSCNTDNRVTRHGVGLSLILLLEGKPAGVLKDDTELR